MSGQFNAALLLGLVVWAGAKFVFSASEKTVWILAAGAAILGWWIAGMKPFQWQTQNQNVDATPNVGF
ncbi:MAG: hypothetical protein KGL39_26090 [Patescibacteria group bacterium]|nr:hypothetical protein [Patescibacteria group bacterium]